MAGQQPQTQTHQAPGGQASPGYGWAKGFFDSLPGVTRNPYPGYQGQLDPGLSPTMQNAIRMSQGYSQAGPSEILQGAQGSLGRFMTPSFMDPRMRLPMGSPNLFGADPSQKMYGGGSLGQLGQGFSGGMQNQIGGGLMNQQMPQFGGNQMGGGRMPNPFAVGGPGGAMQSMTGPGLQSGGQGPQMAYRGGGGMPNPWSSQSGGGSPWSSQPTPGSSNEIGGGRMPWTGAPPQSPWGGGGGGVAGGSGPGGMDYTTGGGLMGGGTAPGMASGGGSYSPMGGGGTSPGHPGMVASAGGQNPMDVQNYWTPDRMASAGAGSYGGGSGGYSRMAGGGGMAGGSVAGPNPFGPGSGTAPGAPGNGVYSSGNSNDDPGYWTPERMAAANAQSQGGGGGGYARMAGGGGGGVAPAGQYGGQVGGQKAWDMGNQANRGQVVDGKIWMGGGQGGDSGQWQNYDPNNWGQRQTADMFNRYGSNWASGSGATGAHGSEMQGYLQNWLGRDPTEQEKYDLYYGVNPDAAKIKASFAAQSSAYDPSSASYDPNARYGSAAYRGPGKGSPALPGGGGAPGAGQVRGGQPNLAALLSGLNPQKRKVG
jgi:hypothetical protein